MAGKLKQANGDRGQLALEQELVALGTGDPTLDTLVSLLVIIAKRLMNVVTRLEGVREAVILPPGIAMSAPPAITRVLTVVTVGTAVRGPDVEVPLGYALLIRQRYHSGTPNGYIAFTEAEVQNTLTRTEIRDNDAIAVKRISNLDQVWGDSDTAGTAFELTIEYGG